MPITVQCDSCFQSYRVRDDKAGTVIKCKECGARIKVPAGADGPDDDDGVEEEVAPQRSAKSSRKPLRGKKHRAGANPVLLLTGAVGGGGLLIGAVVFLLMRGGGEPPQPAPADVAGTQQPATPAPAATVAAGAANAPVSAPGSTTGIVEGQGQQPPAEAAKSGNGAPPAVAAGPAALSRNTEAWKVTADPPADRIEWPESLDVSIAIGGKALDDFFYPSLSSPFVVVGADDSGLAAAQIWNIVKGEKSGEIRGNISVTASRAVSPDGKYLALSALVKGFDYQFEIWSFETGARVSVIDYRDNLLKLFDFIAPGKFFTCASEPNTDGKSGIQLKTWDVLSGKVLRQVSVPEIPFFHFNKDRCALSPGGRYLAVMDIEGTIHVYEVDSGILAGKAVHPQQAGDETLSPEFLTFTPDGQHMVVLLYGVNETRIMTISMQTGERVPEFGASYPVSLKIPLMGYLGPALECLPNGDGFLLEGKVWFDGKTRRLVWYLNAADRTSAIRHLRPIPNGLLVPEGAGDARRLRVVKVPWTQIQSTLAAFKSEESGRVRPGIAVSLDVQMGALETTRPDAAKAAIREALAARLATEGFEVKEAQPVTFRFRCLEGSSADAAGAKGNPPPAGSKIGHVNLSWLGDGGKTVLWSQDVQMNPNMRIFAEGMTAEDSSNAKFHLRDELAQVPIPYFVPDDKSLVQLPGASALQDSSPPARSSSKVRPNTSKKPKKK